MKHDSHAKRFDVIVLGGGHAGCEAATAAARMGARTALVTKALSDLGVMSCNPAIGGLGKGQIVREIDALDGLMGRMADRAGIQIKVLNRSRGPAARGPRAQIDRHLYSRAMQQELAGYANLSVVAGMATSLEVSDGRAYGLVLSSGELLTAGAIVLTAGTFLRGMIHIGRKRLSAGRVDEAPADSLGLCLETLGLPVGRLKTGTPARLSGSSIDWAALEKQAGDSEPEAFSFLSGDIATPQVACHITRTTKATHQAVREALVDSPLHTGAIVGQGPRYCPSIEDKVVKFADKDRHQLFLEPEGHNTNEVYLNGFSTSLPSQLQQELLRMVPGFENVSLIRPGYAIEYDFVDPRKLRPTMESSQMSGLFLAGQINGTTGYEEAACQGLLAGINAALSIQGRKPCVLERDQAYIGVLADDLIRHGVDEPYRLFTSRAEARLLLRHDNADRRLSPLGRELGLVGDRDWERFNEKRDRIARLRNLLDSTKFRRSSVEYASVAQLLNTDLGDSFTLSQLSMRPEVSSDLIVRLLPEEVRKSVRTSELETALADSLYSGYVEKQKVANERVNHHDSLRVPDGFSFGTINGLSNEMVERLERARPRNFAQVKKISGLTPAAISTVLVHLTAYKPQDNNLS